MKVNVFVWRANKEELELVDKIIQVIQNEVETEDIDFSLKDVSSFEPNPNNEDPTIVFGSIASAQITSNKIVLYWTLPELSKLEDKIDNKSIRITTFKKLKEIGERLSLYILQTKQKFESHVILDSAYSVGIGEGVADIQLSQSEIDNLLKIKELLNGCKIVLTKGDIRIEVE